MKCRKQENRIRIIKLFIFSVVIFTLLINLVWLGYVEHCQKYYTDYNNEVSSYFNKHWKDGVEYNQKACFSLKPNSLLPTYHILGHWSGLMILISIAIMIIVKIDSKISKREMFSRKEKYILLSIVLISFIMDFHVGLIELNFYYFGWNCSQFFL